MFPAEIWLMFLESCGVRMITPFWETSHFLREVAENYVRVHPPDLRKVIKHDAYPFLNPAMAKICIHHENLQTLLGFRAFRCIGHLAFMCRGHIPHIMHVLYESNHLRHAYYLGKALEWEFDGLRRHVVALHKHKPTQKRLIKYTEELMKRITPCSRSSYHLLNVFDHVHPKDIPVVLRYMAERVPNFTGHLSSITCHLTDPGSRNICGLMIMDLQYQSAQH